MSPPKMRRAASAKGSPYRKLQRSPATDASKYSPDEIEASVSVYLGRKFLGTIDHIGDVHHARSAGGVELGVFETRQAALRAIGARD